MVKAKVKKERVMRRNIKIVTVVMVISFLLMLYATFNAQIIPGKYLGLVFLVSMLMTITIVYLQLMTKISLKRSLILAGISMIMIISNAVVFIVGMSTSGFISSIQTSPESYEEYSIVAMKARAIKLSTPGQTVGLLQHDDNLTAVTAGVNEKTAATPAEYENPTTMTVALQDNTIHMAVMKSSYLKLLQETANNELFAQLEVLATFKVKTKQTTTAASADMTKPFIIYISGIDTYGAISTTSRSDVNILAVVNPITHQVLLVNTPRDYYVQLHGTTGRKDKLTHAGIYGIDTSVATMEDLYGADINYNMRINFSSLVKVVDSLGGVDVDSEYNFSSDGHAFTVGKNHLNGVQALAFSRNRYSFEGGDRTRGENQLRVIQAIIAKISTPSTIVNYQQVMTSLQGVFQTNMNSTDITTLFRNQLDSMAKWKTTSISVDGTNATDYTYSMGNVPLYVMVPDQTSLQFAKDKIQRSLAQ